jgi:hypothetical protein
VVSPICAALPRIGDPRTAAALAEPGGVMNRLPSYNRGEYVYITKIFSL